MSIFGHYAKVTAPKEFTFEEALKKIKEGTAAAEECGWDPEKLHCRGCINTCRLASPRCDMGRRVAAAVKKQ